MSPARSSQYQDVWHPARRPVAVAIGVVCLALVGWGSGVGLSGAVGGGSVFDAIDDDELLWFVDFVDDPVGAASC